MGYANTIWYKAVRIFDKCFLLYRVMEHMDVFIMFHCVDLCFTHMATQPFNFDYVLVALDLNLCGSV